MTSLHEWLSQAKGRVLESIEMSIHVLDGVSSEHPNEICFHFEGLEVGTLEPCNTGESVCFSSKRLIRSEMGEYGQVEVRDIDRSCEHGFVIGKRLLHVSLISSLYSSEVIGVSLAFEGNEYLSVIVLGDDLHLFARIPEPLLTEIKSEQVL